ncbi:hypothetical protein CAJAP_01579 [Camponotus japonicus]
MNRGTEHTGARQVWRMAEGMPLRTQDAWESRNGAATASSEMEVGPGCRNRPDGEIDLQAHRTPQSLKRRAERAAAEDLSLRDLSKRERRGVTIKITAVKAARTDRTTQHP